MEQVFNKKKIYLNIIFYISIIMNTTIFNIDSRYRNSTSFPTSTNFEYDLASVGNFNMKNVTQLKLSSIELPNTSYVFSSAKGNITFKVDSVTYTITAGNYNTTDLNTELTNLSISGVTFTIDSNSGKYTITTSSSKVFDFSNTTDYGTLGNFLGFTSDTYTIDGTQEAENIPNVIGENSYFLKINDYGNITNNGKNYMMKVIVTSPLFEASFDSRQRYVTKTYQFSQPTNLTKLEIRLDDYLGNIVDLNGLNFSFTLEVITIHNKILKNYNELSFYSKDLLELILHDNMLEYYSRENKSQNENRTEIFKNNNIGNPVLNQMKNKYHNTNYIGDQPVGNINTLGDVNFNNLQEFSYENFDNDKNNDKNDGDGENFRY